jgi:hypothetical protein
LWDDKKLTRNPKTDKYQKWTFYPHDNQQNWHTKKHKVQEKRTSSTKAQAQECIKDTWRSSWQPVDVMSSAMPENEHADTHTLNYMSGLVTFM